MATQQPDPETRIAALIARWPRTARVLLDLQLGCVGCPMSRFCSVADVARDYAISLDDLLAKLRRAAAEPPTDRAGQRGPAGPAEGSDRQAGLDVSRSAPARPRRGPRAVLALASLAGLLLAQGCSWLTAPLEPRAASAPATPVDAASLAEPMPTESPAAREALDREPGPDGLLGFPVLPERPAPELRLDASGGGSWQLSDQRGRIVAIFFGYTHCPDVCPQTLNLARQALLQLDEGQRADVTVALVTVDPERDDAERLATYVAGFGPEFLGLRGEPEQVAAVAAAYGVRFEKELPEGADAGADAPGQDYTVAHSGSVFIVDASGQLRSTFKGAFTPDEMAHDLRLLLEERRP